MAKISIMFNDSSIQELYSKYCKLELNEEDILDLEATKRYLTREWKKTVHLYYKDLQGKELTLTTFEKIHKGDFTLQGTKPNRLAETKNSLLERKELHNELLQIINKIEATVVSSNHKANLRTKLDKCLEHLDSNPKDEFRTKLQNTLLLIKQQLYGQ